VLNKSKFQRPFKSPTNYQRVLDEFKKQPEEWFTFEEVNAFSLISGMSGSTKSRAISVLIQKGFLERRKIKGTHHYEYKFPIKTHKE
jgi:predicted transcriptional regulator